MDWNSASVGLVVTGSLFAGLQLWWIGSLLRRNRRRRGAEPLSQKDFRLELERIFSKSP
mgnify:FL=1|jgi:hypothetical protein|tara:strand:+ start:400 stop:576 length:177 start_codon:yes stop_codon:yes gene_type:complete